MTGCHPLLLVLAPVLELEDEFDLVLLVTGCHPLPLEFEFAILLVLEEGLEVEKVPGFDNKLLMFPRKLSERIVVFCCTV